MVCTTFLSDSELDQPTGDTELDELLVEAKKLTGKNYQIVAHRRVERFGFLWLRKRTVSTPGIYVEVGGVGPWQELLCAKGKDRVEAFLFGLINGCMATNRKAQQQGGGEDEL